MSNILQMKNITKIFPGIKANDNINFDLKRGEVHALLGENGAGKSTLMSVLFGIYKQEEGEIFINNEIVDIADPKVATKLGLGMVHQHFKLVHNFTAIQNIILGIEETKKGVLNYKNARKKIIELSNKYNLNIDPDTKISDMSVGMQQRVEILKVLYRDASIIILDEPTAVLTPQEIDELMNIIKVFTKEGKSVIFISHKLKEIMSVADRCTVLKRGRHIGTVNIKDTNENELSKMMVGREVNFKVDKKDQNLGDIVLDVNNLNYINEETKEKVLNNISFNVRKGEILGIAGIEGNGQTELVYALTGLIKQSSGEIILNNEPIHNLCIRNRTLKGISHIPEDRHKHGLILDYPLEYNLLLQEYFKNDYQNKGFIKFDKITNKSIELIEKFDIRSGKGPKSHTRGLSGGNQQKAIIAREINRSSDLLIAVQPTRGVDVGAIEYIHNQLVNERDNNKAVLLVSLELDELFNVSDRILVIYEGNIVAEVDPKNTSYEEIGLYMSGAKEGNIL